MLTGQGLGTVGAQLSGQQPWQLAAEALEGTGVGVGLLTLGWTPLSLACRVGSSRAGPQWGQAPGAHAALCPERVQRGPWVPGAELVSVRV